MTHDFRSTPQDKWNPNIPCEAAQKRARTFIDYVNQLKTCIGCTVTLPWESFRPTEWGYPATRCKPCHTKQVRERMRRIEGVQEENYKVDDDGNRIKLR